MFSLFSRRSLPALWATGVICTGSAVAQTAIVENFSDGNRLNGPSATDILFLSQSSGLTLAINNTAPTITDNALKVTLANGPTFVPIVGVFSTGGLSLQNVGDFLTISFDLQLTTTTGDFRFGLYNFAGTPTSIDEGDASTATSANDFGYRYALTAGGLGTSNGFFQETGVTAPAGGGETTAGTITNGAGAAQPALGLGTNNVSLTITRQAAGVALTASLNNTVIRSATDGGNLREATNSNTEATTNQFYATFNELVFNTGSNNASFVLDNVSVTSNVTSVPEPAAAASLVVGALTMLSYRRRLSSARV